MFSTFRSCFEMTVVFYHSPIHGLVRWPTSGTAKKKSSLQNRKLTAKKRRSWQKKKAHVTWRRKLKTHCGRRYFSYIKLSYRTFLSKAVKFYFNVTLCVICYILRRNSSLGSSRNFFFREERLQDKPKERLPDLDTLEWVRQCDHVLFFMWQREKPWE